MGELSIELYLYLSNPLRCKGLRYLEIESFEVILAASSERLLTFDFYFIEFLYTL